MSMFPEIETGKLGSTFDGWQVVKAAIEEAGMKFTCRSAYGVPFYEISDPDPARAALSRIEIRQAEQHRVLLRALWTVTRVSLASAIAEIGGEIGG